MGKREIAANVLGTIGTVLWCVQLVPQVWYNWRRKKTDGLPALMMFFWALSGLPFGVYMILQQVNIPIQVQPQLFGVLSVVCWAQILYYNNGYSRIKSIMLGTGTAALIGGFEALFILTLRIPYRKGITWPALLFGVIASILLALGLIPPYFELWKRNGRVIGINWIFLGMDTSGALLSLLALAAEGSFDIMGGILYIIVLLLELGIFSSHIIWRLRHRGLIKKAKQSGKTVDEILECNEVDGGANAAPGRGETDKGEAVPGDVAGWDGDIEAQSQGGHRPWEVRTEKKDG